MIGGTTKALLAELGRRVASARRAGPLSDEEELGFLQELRTIGGVAALSPAEALLAAPGAEGSRQAQEWAFESLGRAGGMPKAQAARLIERCAKALGAAPAAKGMWGPEPNAWGLCRLAEAAGAESETEASRRALKAVAEGFEREWRETGRVRDYFLAAAAMEASGGWLETAREMVSSKSARVVLSGREITVPKQGGGWREYRSKLGGEAEMTPGGLRALWDELLSRGEEGPEIGAGGDLGMAEPEESERLAGRATAQELVWGTFVGKYWEGEEDWPDSQEEARGRARALREAAALKAESKASACGKKARL